ncbi:DUF6919 domain-containing protein [Streptomyces mauvecolor]|uniref:DUF6919 domain-containing protein n=2 Tax=Streptomyces mauvecolor TaxID=58345 RepID=A0ABV9UF83_9ACTN
MSRTDRRRWRTASSLTDLGQLAASWWEGTVRGVPGHRAGFRPSPDLAEQVPVLAAVNRAGFLVLAAQAGVVDGTVQARAAVQGFARDPALIRRLVDAAENADLTVVLNNLLDAGGVPSEGVTVTVGDPRGDVAFGQALGVADLEAAWRGYPAAKAAVAPTLQITLAAPQFGPHTLVWDVLAAAVPPAPVPAPTVVCRECGCTAIEWQICGDGCTGVTDQADGRCAACIDPSVIIDWSKEGVEIECANCGAPHFSARKYCSTGCEIADAYDEDQDVSGESAAPGPGGDLPDDPWASAPTSAHSRDLPF